MLQDQSKMNDMEEVKKEVLKLQDKMKQAVKDLQDGMNSSLKAMLKDHIQQAMIELQESAESQGTLV